MDYNDDDVWHGVAELPSYIKQAERFLDGQERQDLILYLAAHPKAGVIIEGAGGIRKLRWRRGGQGKRGGLRVVYYYHSSSMPLYLLALFAKGDKSDLTRTECRQLAELVDVLVGIWKGRSS